MNLKKYGFENTEKDIISKIYHNDMEEIQVLNQSKEYVKISKKLKKLEKMLLKEFTQERVKQYIEYTNEKMSVEAESQFRLGFKMAIKIIFQALK